MPDGRFAPSPTGDLHIGNLRTALVAWLCARSAGSRVLVRIEDLDRNAARPDIARRQLDDLTGLGLDWDGPVVAQSDRLDRYRDAIGQLEHDGLTYPCYCSRREIREAASAPNGPGHGRGGGRSSEDGPTPARLDGAYPGTCRNLTRAQRAEREAAGRPPALRVRGAGARFGFEDRFAGWFEGEVDDLVIRRNDATPAYHLAVVVDDADQGVGEVVRGDDLLTSTPRHLHLARLLGLTAPEYGHVPLVLGPDGARLAKRDGAVTLADRAARGIGPAEVLGELATSLGLAEPGAQVEPATLVERFVSTVLPREPWVLTAEVLDP